MAHTTPFHHHTSSTRTFLPASGDVFVPWRQERGIYVPFDCQLPPPVAESPAPPTIVWLDPEMAKNRRSAKTINWGDGGPASDFDAEGSPDWVPNIVEQHMFYGACTLPGVKIDPTQRTILVHPETWEEMSETDKRRFAPYDVRKVPRIDTWMQKWQAMENQEIADLTTR